MKNIKRKPFLLFPWRWLWGAGKIAQFTGHEIHEVINWALFWDDCPIRKDAADLVWVVKKRDIKRFIKEKNPPRTEISEILYKKEPKKNTRRLWKW